MLRDVIDHELQHLLRCPHILFSAPSFSDIQAVLDHLGNVSIIIKDRVAVDLLISGVAVLVKVNVLNYDGLFGSLDDLKRTRVVSHARWRYCATL